MKLTYLLTTCLSLLATNAFATSYVFRLNIPGLQGPAAAAPVAPVAHTYATWDITGVNIPGVDPAYGLILSADKLTTSQQMNWQLSMRATMGKSTGKWYWEVHVNDVGYTNANWLAGIADGAFPLHGADQNSPNSPLGGADSSYGVQVGAANAYTQWPGAAGSTTEQGVWIGVGSTLQFALDMDNKALYVGVDGVWRGSQPYGAGGGDPTSGAAKTDASVTGLSGTVYPALTPIYGTGHTTANFGASAFQYAVPAGYNPGVYQ